VTRHRLVSKLNSSAVYIKVHSECFMSQDTHDNAFKLDLFSVVLLMFNVHILYYHSST